MNQSKLIAGGINQQPMHAVSAAIANSININLQSIFKQYTKRQQPLNAQLTSMHSASISMRRLSTVSVQNINNQCTHCQQPMFSASTANVDITRLPYARFLQNEDFHSEKYASKTCHSVLSQRRSRRIHPSRKYPFEGCMEGSSLKTPLPLREK